MNKVNRIKSRRARLALAGLFMFGFAGLSGVWAQKIKTKPAAPIIPEKTAPVPVARPPKWEFSTAVSFLRSGISYENQTNTVTTISVPLRLGYSLMKSIEIEPEVIFTQLSQEDASAMNVSAMANVLFNISFGRRLNVFVLGGAGAILMSAKIGGTSDSRTDIGYNGGAGLRLFMSDKVALRAEYRLVYYTDKPADLTSKVTYMDHKGFLGISVFF